MNGENTGEPMNKIKEAISDAVSAVATQPASEGKWTKRIENQTAKVPSIVFLNLALAGIAYSALHKMIRPKSTIPNFVGLLVPTFLLLGLYNKIVKIEGNDRFNRT
jgi:hypothetical protein